jgi:hypothetical protein
MLIHNKANDYTTIIDDFLDLSARLTQADLG